jgi:hypothetical protein
MNTGSLINKLADESTQSTKPEVGMGATVILWSDRKAATIIEVSKTAHRVVVQFDTATRVDSNGMSDAQSYTYEPNPEGGVETYSRRRDGSYRVVGGQGRLLLNVRDAYHDYSF